MGILIVIFGILMFLAGIFLIIKPDIIFKVLRENSDKLWLHIGAVVMRLLLGILLIYQAKVSKFPVTIEVIGWVTIFAALVLLVMGRKNFKHLLSWAFTLVEPFGRIAGALALCFGSFLIYVFV